MIVMMMMMMFDNIIVVWIQKKLVIVMMMMSIIIIGAEGKDYFFGSLFADDINKMFRFLLEGQVHSI